MSFFKRLVPLKAEMHLNFQELAVEQGRPLRGLAILEAKESFKVEEVRIEIRVKERWTERRWERDPQGHQRQVTRQMEETRFTQDVPVSQSFDATEGDKRQFPVEVTIPFFQPTRGTVYYSVKAVANVKGRPDVTSEVSPTILPPTGTTTIIERQVVKVPCRYCGTLVELTAGVSKCPSCGAPLNVQ